MKTQPFYLKCSKLPNWRNISPDGHSKNDQVFICHIPDTLLITVKHLGGKGCVDYRELKRSKNTLCHFVERTIASQWSYVRHAVLQELLLVAIDSLTLHEAILPHLKPLRLADITTSGSIIYSHILWNTVFLPISLDVNFLLIYH